jgi:methionine aminopeptidase
MFVSSVNEVICHGIPDHRKLKDGDIVNLGKHAPIPSGFPVIAHATQMYLYTMTVCRNLALFNTVVT